MKKTRSKRRYRKKTKKNRKRVAGNIITPNTKFKLAYQWRANLTNN